MRSYGIAFSCGLFVLGNLPAAAATLEAVKERGSLTCGVNQGLTGFAEKSGEKWQGFDVDFCRAVAAAVFGDAGKVGFVPLGAAERFDALKDGKVDILARNTTWTIDRETQYGLTFIGVTYYDGQGFMVPRSANILSALELTGRKICVQEGTTTLANLADYFGVNNMTYEAVVTKSTDDSLARYKDKACDTMTSDLSQLYSARTELDNPDDQVVLADAISKEPLGPAVRADDPKWATLVKWVHFALLDAEELGVGQATLEEALKSTKPDVRRLLGAEGDFGSRLGVKNDWVVSMLRLVGNYGEIYERNLGGGSKLGIPRGMNQLWSLGGVQYAPPIR